MRQLLVFNSVTADGYFTNKNGDMSWAHKDDPEWNEFVADNSKSGGELLFGRITFEMMASYWPTPFAKENDPIIADKMNTIPKFVFSNTLDKVEWSNSRLVTENIAGEISQLKQEKGRDLALFGSANLAVSLLQLGLIDELRIMVNPVVLGKGKPLFTGLHDKVKLKLIKTRTFRSGNVLLYYQPDKK